MSQITRQKAILSISSLSTMLQVLIVIVLLFTTILVPTPVNSLLLVPKTSTATKKITTYNNNQNILQNRKQVLQKFLSSSVFLIATTTTPAAYAVDGDVKWMTGKAPKVEGKKPKDPTDVKGTRKDPSFLRSISDCKNKCESTPGPDGYSISKEDCLSTCQDVCCTTYEQCTFAIVPRL